MKAQFTLTVTEAKKLIAKAVTRLEIVKNALTSGIIVIHPSTTTSFIIEELYGKFPTAGFVCGVITPKGTCTSKEMAEMLAEKCVKGPGDFPPWVIMHGKLHENIRLMDALEKMSSNDVYIKTGNALDVNGNVGVLVGAPEGGPLGLALSACKAKGIKVVIPIGLEKMIPISVEEASAEAYARKLDYSMGMSVGLLPMRGLVVTELDAVKVLTGASAVPIGAGGLMGAEGATTMIVKGEKWQVEKAIKIVESLKGSKLPPVILAECASCTCPTCPNAGKNLK
ncbi:MAG: hypothetical protein QW717_03335 [Candidatus Bathyarchaeia archaeon]